MIKNKFKIFSTKKMTYLKQNKKMTKNKLKTFCKNKIKSNKK